MAKTTQIALLALILGLAATLRLTNLDWDEYNHYHPDERYISWVATSIDWPQQFDTALDPRRTSFNPFYWPPEAASEGLELDQDEPRRYAYGHLPLYLGVGATRFLERVGPAIVPLLPENWLLTRNILNGADVIEYRHITAAGRALTGLVDVASVGLLFLLGRQLFSPTTGLLAAAFLALNVMHIQLAHFFAVDPYLTFFVLAAVVLMVLSLRNQQRPTMRMLYLLLAAASTGLAVGSKFSGILLLLPLALTVLMEQRLSLIRRLLHYLAAAAVAFVVFALTNPFAILDLTCSSAAIFRVGPIQIPGRYLTNCYLQNVTLQGAMVRGLRDVPFVRQYAGTIPFIYYIEMQLRWGMGLLLGLVGFAGLAWATWRVFRGLRNWREKRRARKMSLSEPIAWQSASDRFPIGPAELVLLSWSLPFFLTTGILDVKFMRYMQPLVPFLMLYGAALLLSIRAVAWRRAAMGLVLVFTALYALAFMNMYRQPHPWLSASRWMYENLEPGAYVLNEAWDDPLPDNMTLDDTRRRRNEFLVRDVNWLSGTEEDDSLEKLEENLALLSAADYLAISSNRNYGVIPRLPERYPLSSQYYPLLFGGQLGYKVVYAGTRSPNLLGLHLKPDHFAWPQLQPPAELSAFLDELPGLTLGRFDESFTVYDQPLVIIFKNQEGLSAKEMAKLFDLCPESSGD